MNSSHSSSSMILEAPEWLDWRSDCSAGRAESGRRRWRSEWCGGVMVHFQLDQKRRYITSPLVAVKHDTRRREPQCDSAQFYAVLQSSQGSWPRRFGALARRIVCVHRPRLLRRFRSAAKRSCRASMIARTSMPGFSSRYFSTTRPKRFTLASVFLSNRDLFTVPASRRSYQFVYHTYSSADARSVETMLPL